MILKLVIFVQWTFLMMPESEGYGVLWRSVPSNVEDILSGSYATNTVSSLIKCVAIASQTYDAALACFDGSSCAVGLGDLEPIRGPLQAGWTCMTSRPVSCLRPDGTVMAMFEEHTQDPLGPLTEACTLEGRFPRTLTCCSLPWNLTPTGCLLNVHVLSTYLQSRVYCHKIGGALYSANTTQNFLDMKSWAAAKAAMSGGWYYVDVQYSGSSKYWVRNGRLVATTEWNTAPINTVGNDCAVLRQPNKLSENFCGAGQYLICQAALASC